MEVGGESMAWYDIILQILISIIVSGGAVTLIIKGAVGNFFSKQLKSHKQSLNLIVENKKFDIQRMMHDFSLYRNKKHEIYPELYKLMVTTVDNIKEIKQNWYWPNYENHSREMIKETLENFRVKKKVIDRIISDWTVNKSIEDMKYEIKMQALTESIDDFRKTKDYFVQSELFISDCIADLIHSVLEKVDDYSKRTGLLILSKSYDIPPNSTMANKLEEIESLEQSIFF